MTKIYQTFQPTAEELKPSEKWNTLLPRHQTGAILIYHKAWFTLKIIDTNSIHSALLCQCLSTRAEHKAQTQPLSAMPEQGAANPNKNQGWMIIAQIRTGHQLFSQSFAKLKHAANQNYFESWVSGKTFTPWGQESNGAVCPKPALTLCLDIFETRLNSIPSTMVWPHSRSCLEQTTGQDHLPRSPSKLNYPMNHSWALPSHTHAGTGLTLLSWVTWLFHSWDTSFLKHLTPQ